MTCGSFKGKTMKKQNRALLCAITALLLAACLDPLKSTRQEAVGSAGRVIISISGEGDSPEPEAAQSVSQTLLPEYGVLSYTVRIAKDGTAVFTQTITETSVAADIDAGTYTVSVSAKNTGGTLVAEAISQPRRNWRPFGTISHPPP